MEQPERWCAKCGKNRAGPGGILCPGCRAWIAQQRPDYWQRVPQHADVTADDVVAAPPGGSQD